MGTCKAKRRADVTNEGERMRYEVYDEEGTLIRKFWTKAEAENFLQVDWKLVVKPRFRQQPEIKPTPETHGEARW